MASKHKHHQEKDKIDQGINYEPTNPPKHPDEAPFDQEGSELEVDIENEDEDEIREDLAQYTDDQDVIDDFAQRQEMNTGGERLFDTLEQHTMTSPEDSAGDVDAEWDDALASGEETLGGDSPTPDQDVVDDLGDAAGLNYGLEEPLNADKIADRDRNRWELNPASAEDTDFSSNLPIDEDDLEADRDKTEEDDEDCADEEA